MPEPQIFLDLDRTLFRTAEFDQEKWQFLAERYPAVILPERERGRQSEFYRYDGELYAYDFKAHLEALGLDPQLVKIELLQSPLADGHLEYTGAGELAAWAKNRDRAVILTYGDAWYQRLKRDLCPGLRGVEFITTLRPKAEFFQELLAAGKLTGDVWMVDDKPIGDELPAGVRFIQALLDGQPDPVKSAWPVARTLAQIPDIISQYEISD